MTTKIIQDIGKLFLGNSDEEIIGSDFFEHRTGLRTHESLSRGDLKYIVQLIIDNNGLKERYIKLQRDSVKEIQGGAIEASPKVQSETFELMKLTQELLRGDLRHRYGCLLGEATSLIARYLLAIEK